MKGHFLSAWRWTPKVALHVACEAATAQLYGDADALRAHAKRRTLFPEDLQLARRLRVSAGDPMLRDRSPTPDTSYDLPSGPGVLAEREASKEVKATAEPKPRKKVDPTAKAKARATAKASTEAKAVAKASAKKKAEAKAVPKAKAKGGAKAKAKAKARAKAKASAKAAAKAIAKATATAKATQFRLHFAGMGEHRLTMSVKATLLLWRLRVRLAAKMSVWDADSLHLCDESGSELDYEVGS